MNCVVFAMRDGESVRRYAVDANIIQDILMYSRPTRMPNSKNNISGLLNVRNEVVPVVDLGTVLSADKVEEGARIIVIKTSSEGTVGFMVHSVEVIVKIGEGDVMSTPSGSRGEYILGIIESRNLAEIDADGLVELVDLEKLI